MQKETNRTNSSAEFTTILQRLVRSDRSAVQECIERYGKLIWGLANKYTDSPQKAEQLTLEIFNAIWKNAGRFNSSECDEIAFITLLAMRHLLDVKD